ncbi:MAG TPA: SUMF1/EgtB/PvdO family nonheme iron enzyme [Prolixibacteraceae bacterium]|nr:SUMF1/EgtB/PvdO family nonheme iron enzyme [Prolixibacteraceae bacterium]
MDKRITSLIEDYQCGKIGRRNFLKKLILYAGSATAAISFFPSLKVSASSMSEAGLAAQAQPLVEMQQVIPVRVVLSTSYKFEQLLAGPEKPEDFPAWLAGMRTYRQEMQAILREAIGAMPDPYAEPSLQWARWSFIQPQMMMHDRYFYDPIARRYTVRRYLKDLNTRYGGIDSVLIWPPMYTNLGVDNRNQFDIWRDLPGGFAAIRKMVEEFHEQGVRVLIPIMHWDNGTRDEGVSMAEGLAKLAKELGVDGLNGDTMYPVNRNFYDEALKLGHPLALEPEAGMGNTINGLAWNVLSWGYWWPDPSGPYPSVPAVDRYKFIEPRHLTHVCDRWAHDRTDMLQYAFFNGDGYESWENIFGVWNQITPRDAEALRRISAIYRALPELLISPDYEPFTPNLQKDIYVTKFPGKSTTLWTFINRASTTAIGAQIQVPFSPGMRFFDLWRGSELNPQVSGDKATLSFELESRGYGAILATEASPVRPVKALLAAMQQRSRIKLNDLSNEWKVLPQQIVEITSTTPVSNPPKGMIQIPAGKFKFEVEGMLNWNNEGVDVQYPWEDKPSLKHSHDMSIKSFYIDTTPVTCDEFKRFMDATHYRPKDSHNFLRNWVNGSLPQDWAKKPVTWVSLEDARVYAKWAHKRLPNEWEWQYAAQGTDGRLYPWGNEKDDTRMPPFEQTRDQRPPTDVDAYPQGASPFGVIDMVGNVWQWTNEYRDEHNRAAVLRGGSYYRPAGSEYYFPQALQLNQHGKYWLLTDSTDRSATIGFRCAVDAE